LLAGSDATVCSWLNPAGAYPNPAHVQLATNAVMFKDRNAGREKLDKLGWTARDLVARAN